MKKLERVKAASVRSDFAELVNRVRYQNSRVLVLRHGEPMVALVSLQDLEALERRLYKTIPAERVNA